MKEFALLVAGFMGAGIVFLNFPDLAKSLSVNSWAKVQAYILASGVDEINSIDGGVVNYSPWIEYEYGYRQKMHKSEKVYLVRSSYFDRDDASLHVYNFKTGAEISVWVNPKNTKDSLLKSGINWRSLVSVFFGASLFGFAAFQFFKV